MKQRHDGSTRVDAIVGNWMSVKGMRAMCDRIFSGQTTLLEEAVANLTGQPVFITSPGELDQDGIDRLYTDEGVPAE